MGKLYPQELRNVWANAYARKCGAIWRLVDARAARARASLNKDPNIAALDAQIAELEAARDQVLAETREARAALTAAEAIYFGEET